MKNMMKEYLGNGYTDNHLKNFCLYWMKGRERIAEYASYDDWRKENDLDCLYFDGNMRADTLMSAWTPIKWVADCLNREYDIKFCKTAEDKEDPNHYLRLLADDQDAYLPPKHELVQLLDRFLELAELRCNYILLPDRHMNSARYKTYINGEEALLFDEVPATLHHVYDRNSLGRYFLNERGEHDGNAVREWIRREHLEMGFYHKDINSDSIIPLIPGLNPRTAKWLTDEKEIKEALLYMIRFLEMRKQTLDFHRLTTYEQGGIAMRINDNNRPKEITCDQIWELYKLLEGLDEHYVFYDKCNAPGDHEKLFYLEKTTVGENGICYYGPDSMGFELPYSKDEWVELLLKHIENGRMRQYVCRITVNALHKNEKSVEELLEERHIRIAAGEELSAAEYEEYPSKYDDSKLKLPVINTPVPVRTEFVKKHEEAETVAYWFLKYLRYHFIPYKEDRDGGTLRYTFVFMSENSPGGFVEGCVWFYDKAAEVRVYYNQIGADICKGSEHRSELLRLLNFINARVFMEIRDGAGSRFYDPQILHTPRIYLTEDDGYDISITTMINYKFWKNARLETHDYITAYCPELLDKLSPFIFDTLKGEMSASEAILGIGTKILNEGKK